MNQIKTDIRTVLFGCLLLIGLPMVNAATIVATNGTEVAVNAAIAQAKFGDTVQIPAGTWTWSVGNVGVSGITLAGAGTNATFILDNLPNGWGNFAGFIFGLPVPNAPTRITGITFADAGDVVASYKGKVMIDGRAYGNAASWRIDHCMFVNLNGNNILAYGFAVSVIDHCAFALKGAEAITQYGLSTTPNDPWGDYPWATPAVYGTTNVLYIEDCYFKNSISTDAAGGAFDAEAGAMSVFRNNLLLDCAWFNHGNDTSGRYRSTRSFEIYNNVFIDDQNWVSAMDFRGGTGVVFSNTVTGYKLFDTIENYRNVQPNSFGGVDGSNPWDKTNAVVYYTGTNTTTGGSITCPGANWTPHQWAGYVVSDPAAGTIAVGHGAGSVNYCLIQDNSSDTLTMSPAKDFQIVFTNQDVFNIYYVAAALDQVGRGSGDLIQDVTVGNWPNSVTYTIDTATGTNSWPHQVVEPLYSWGNTLNGSPAGILSGYANIQEGRDIFANAVKPGYSPLPYPHPMVAAAVLAASSNSSSATNSAVTNTVPVLTPPSSLSVSPN